MAVKLRLSRFGRLNHPTYRICAVEGYMKRDGRVIETVGYYLPKAKAVEEQSSLNNERIEYWLSVGAQPSETVASLIKKAGMKLPQSKKNKAKPTRKTPPKFDPPKQVGTGRKAKSRWKAKQAAS